MRHYASAFLPHLLLVLSAACAAQKPLTLEECKGKEPSPAFKNVTISPCDKDPCVIKRGEKYNVSFSFEATSDADFMLLTTVDHQHTDTTNIQSARSISCHFVDLPCNVTKGEVYRGSATLVLYGLHMPGNMTYELDVTSDQETFACGVATLTVE